MAIGDTYATVLELKGRLSIAATDTVDDVRLQSAVATASRGIDKYTRRQFNKADTATPRRFYADTSMKADVDDFHTTSGLIVATDTGYDGTFATTWAASEFEPFPLNGVVDGQPGWPYNKIYSLGPRSFPCDSAFRPTIQVTAAWGWDQVPAEVHEACLIAAAEIFKLKDAPFGVAGVGDWGMIRVRDNPMVTAKLAPYRRYPVLVG